MRIFYYYPLYLCVLTIVFDNCQTLTDYDICDASAALGGGFGPKSPLAQVVGGKIALRSRAIQ